LPADRTSDVRGFEPEKKASKSPPPEEPPPAPPPKNDPVTKETSRVWMWAVIILVVGVGSVWWATQHL
jgi:hypothetical protein